MTSAMAPTSARLLPPSGAMVDDKQAKVALNLLAIGTPIKVVAGVLATSESTVARIKQYAAAHQGEARATHHTICI